MRAKLMAKREGHAIHRSLHEVVEERDAVVRGVVLRRAVVHFDDQRAWLLNHQRQREVAGDRVRVDAKTQQMESVVQIGLPYRLVPLHLGQAEDVVDEDVQRALLAIDARDQRADLVGDEMIDSNSDATPSGRIDESGGLLNRFRAIHLGR
jgi:hypothetical protein